MSKRQVLILELVIHNTDIDTQTSHVRLEHTDSFFHFFVKGTKYCKKVRKIWVLINSDCFSYLILFLCNNKYYLVHC